MIETDGPISTEEEVLAVTSPEQQADSLAFQKAEFEKYKQRTRQGMEASALETREAMVTDFLEVADNLERAIASWKEGEDKGAQSVRDGVDLVLRLFRSKLKRYAVTAIDTEGQPFDPHVHHAVAQAPTTETSPGTVLHEVLKGYWMGGRLLRPANVVVASAPLTANEASAPDEERGSGGESISDWHGYQRNRR
jgi:molecular chaperone GrpE